MKKTAILGLAVLLALSFVLVGCDSQINEEATPRAAAAPLNWTDGFGFHCNAAKGNGKVVTGFEKAHVALLRVGSTTTWDLSYNQDATNAIECPLCKRIDWVTFSNNNGVINGKNIQVNHSGVPAYLWPYDIPCNLDCECKCPGKKGTFAGTEDDYKKFLEDNKDKCVCKCEDDDDDGICEHLNGLVCDNCSGYHLNHGQHPNCFNLPNRANGNWNFFCVDCDKKVGSSNKNPGLTCMY